MAKAKKTEETIAKEVKAAGKTAVKAVKEEVEKVVKEEAEKISNKVEKPAAKAAKAPASKTKKPAVEAKDVYVLQYAGKDIDIQAVAASCKEDYKSKGHRMPKNVTVYIKPEENAAYYTVNGKGSEDFKVDL